MRGTLLLFVSQHVVLKLCSGPEFPRTLVTGIKPPFFMGAHVLQQMKASAETLLTDVTHKHLFCFLDFWCVLTLRVLLLYSIYRNIKTMTG